MKRRILPIIFIVVAVVAGGCVINPTLKPKIPPMVVKDKVRLRVALVVPESSRKFTSAQKLPTPCIGDIAPLPYGLVFEQTVKEMFSRVFEDIALVPSVPQDGEYDAVLEAILTGVSFRVGCMMSPSTYVIVEGSLSSLDPSGKEIWRSGITSKRSDFGLFGLEKGDNISRGLSALVSDWTQEFLVLPVHQYAGGAPRKAPTLEEVQKAQKEGNYTAALATLRRALQQGNPKNLVFYEQAGHLLLHLCDPDGAIQVAEEGLKQSPNEKNLRQLLKTADLEKKGGTPGPYPDACRAQSLNREGVALAREQKLVVALGKFEEAVRATPGLIPKADYNAALILEQMGRPREALPHYVAAQQAFLLPQDQAETLTRLVALTQRAKIPVPDAADRRYRVGILRAQQKRYKEAIEEFEAVLTEAPWLVEAYYNLGLIYDFTGAYQDALHTFRIYVQLAPSASNVGTVKTKIVEIEDRLGVLGPAAR